MGYNDNADILSFLGTALKRAGRTMTNAEIAGKAGFAAPNVISMLKANKFKLPVERIPAFAEAVGVDARILMRLHLDHEFGKGVKSPYETVFGFDRDAA